MAINLSDALPLLQTILRQQSEISEKLGELILTFKHGPEPVEPTLRGLLQPVKDGIDEMKASLEPKGSSEESST